MPDAPLRAVQSGRKSGRDKARETSCRVQAEVDMDVDASLPVRLVAAESSPLFMSPPCCAALPSVPRAFSGSCNANHFIKINLRLEASVSFT